jgi:RecG-like helicase
MSSRTEPVSGEPDIPEGGGRLRRALRRFTAQQTELDAEQLQEQADEAGAVPVKTCHRGEKVCLAGRLKSVVFTPRVDRPTLEAELWDGSDAVTLIWLGRRRIAGIEPGRRIVVRGRVAQQDGRKVMFNPDYELQPVGT